MRQFTPLLIALFIMSGCATVPDWESKHISPTQHEPEIYGGYSAGCMHGAESMPFSGKGFQMVRIHRGRYYGQPSLINFLKKYAEKIDNQNLWFIGSSNLLIFRKN